MSKTMPFVPEIPLFYPIPAAVFFPGAQIELAM